MAIEAHLCLTEDAALQFCGSHSFMNNHSCFTSQQQQQPQLCNLKHQQPAEQCLQPQLLSQKQMMSQNMSLLVDPHFTTLLPDNSNAQLPISINHTHNSQNLPLHFDEMGNDLHHYITSQNENLRVMLEKQRKKQVEALVSKVESDALNMLREKDQQIAQAANKRVELEEFLNRLEAENQTWQRVAQEKEATVLSLYNTLEQIKERAGFNCLNRMMETEDAESCCDKDQRSRMEAEEEGISCSLGEKMMMMVCKHCKCRRSCFMFLPCRHLCSCKFCESFLQACPVCNMPKKSCIETLMV